MKRFAFLILLLIAFKSQSQDTLYYKEGKRELVRLLQINPNDVKFKLWDVPNGPEITVLNNKLCKVVFENGRSYQISATSNTSSPRNENKRVVLLDFRRNSVNFSFSDLFVYRLGLSYERLLGKKGKFSIRVPFSVSLKDTKAVFTEYGGNLTYDYYTSYPEFEMDGKTYSLDIPEFGNSGKKFPFSMASAFTNKPIYINYGNSFYSGIGSRFYVGGQKRKNFFVGLELQGGIYSYQLKNLTNLVYDSNGYLSSSDQITTTKIGGMIGYFLEIGTRINSSSNRLSLAISLGLGQRFQLGAPTKRNNNYTNYPSDLIKNVAINPQLQLVYRFGKKVDLN